MSTREQSSKQEKGVAKKFGTKEQIASGSTPFYKGDGIDEHLLIECKTKMKESKSIKMEKEWFTKAREQANQMRKPNYIVVFNFGEQDWKGDFKDFVAIEDNHFEHLYKSSKALDRIIQEIGLEEEYDFTDDDEAIKERNYIRGIIREELM